MAERFICRECGKTYDPKTFVFRCTCGGMLDLQREAVLFRDADIDRSDWSLFRYRRALPFEPGSRAVARVTMGEGLTPLLPLEPGDPSVLVKLEYAMPTLSFKDRGAAVLMAKALELGVRRVVQDSSGNAGTAVAAYAARAGIACDIFVPGATSPKKIRQIHAHGAAVHVIDGSREDTARAALEAVERTGAFYASHVYNPYFYEGTKTYAYEIYEQTGGRVPEQLFIPAGNGTLVLGTYYGFRELMANGLIPRLPRIVAIQAAGCSPVYQAFTRGGTAVPPAENTGTAAEGIAIAAPRRGGQILEAVRATGGEVILAPEAEIASAREWLARRGFYVEITTAATFAAFFEYRRAHELRGISVLPLCGAGLKSD